VNRRSREPGFFPGSLTQAYREIVMDKELLDNRTIAKLVMAIAWAIDLRKDGEVIGPTAPKVLEYLDEIDSLHHFVGHKPGQKV
jgi:hypothetical protein